MPDLSLDAVRSASDRAFTNTSPSPTHVMLAGRVVRFEVAGAALFDRLFPALAHLELSRPDASTDALPHASVALTVRIWDTAETGVGHPQPAVADPGMNGVVTVSDDRQRVRHDRRTSTAWLDRERGELFACFPSAAATSLYDRGKPLHLPLAVWHLDRGIPLIHAGVVARHGRGVLFPGKGGSGKTTASLSCALAGYDYVGDDCVGVDLGMQRHVIAHSVFGSANVAPHHLSRFPSLVPHAIAGTMPDEDKHLVLLRPLLPRPLSRLATVRAIVMPTIAGHAATRLVPATRADALRTLAPSTLLFFPGAAAGQMAFLAELVAAVPCYRLEMSPRLEEIPACLDEFLGSAAS